MGTEEFIDSLALIQNAGQKKGHPPIKLVGCQRVPRGSLPSSQVKIKQSSGSITKLFLAYVSEPLVVSQGMFLAQMSF